MRERMPKVTAFIDAMREAFGAAEVDAMIRAGLQDGSFRAEENGYTVGNQEKQHERQG